MRKKLRESRGETLVETFAAIVVATLSVALLFGGIVASGRIENSAKHSDEAHYEALSAAEKQEAAADGLTGPFWVTVTNPVNSGIASIEVNLYGGDGVYSYKKVGP